MDAFRIIAEKQALQWFAQIFDKTGPTFEQNVLGVKGVDTIEPENLEAILSTKFSGEFLRLPMHFSPKSGAK